MTETVVGDRTAALVVAAQSGDRDALHELTAAHLPLVYNVVGRALNGHADVDDGARRGPRLVPGAAARSRSHAYVCLACQHDIFRRLSVHDNVESGLTLRNDGTIGNQVLDSDLYRNRNPADQGQSGIGLGVKFGNGEGNLIRGCRAFDNADDGFDLGDFRSR